MKKPSIGESLPGAIVGGLFAFVALLALGRSLGAAAVNAALIAVVCVPTLYFWRMRAYRRAGGR